MVPFSGFLQIKYSNDWFVSEQLPSTKSSVVDKYIWRLSKIYFIIAYLHNAGNFFFLLTRFAGYISLLA